MSDEVIHTVKCPICGNPTTFQAPKVDVESSIPCSHPLECQFLLEKSQYIYCFRCGIARAR